MVDQQNYFELSGNLQTLEKVRWTPSGVPVRSGSVEHVSTLAGEKPPLHLSFSMPFVVIGETARCLDESCLGRKVFLSGFLVSSRKRTHIPSLELRVRSVEFERESIESV